MEPVVAGQLGVEGHGEHVALLHSDRMVINRSEHLHLGPVFVNPGRADENCTQRPEALQVEVGFEALGLATEGVAPRSRRAGPGDRGRA